MRQTQAHVPCTRPNYPYPCARSKNIAAIQHMAGHKNLASTMRYVHGSLEGARALLEEVERVDEEAEKKEPNSSHSGQVSGQDDESCPGEGS